MRERQFAVMSPTEEDLIFSWLQGTHTVDDALRNFGAPGSDLAGDMGIRGPDVDAVALHDGRFRHIIYAQPPPTLDIQLRIDRAGGVQRRPQGKCLGKRTA